MKKRITILTMLFAFVINAQAQLSSIKGRVYNAINNEIIQDAHIKLSIGNQSTTTDKNGYFIIKGLEGKKYELKISHISFEEYTLEIKAKESGMQVSAYLEPKIYEKEMVIVSATRSKKSLNEVPGKIVVITRKEIDKIPAQKVDDILKYVSGLNTSRSSGLYSMRPIVTLRGLSGDEQGRTLVLINGVPINKGDTGGVNWNRIDTDQIERIEIYKGPGSSLYGNNAMGGVINIITRKPKKLLEGMASITYGTYDTKQAKVSVGSRFNDAAYVQFSAFYTDSDGYNLIPEDKRKEPDYSIARFLEEKGISVKAGCEINQALNLELHYDYFEDKRGEGEKIEAPLGEYRHFNTHFFRGKMNGNLGSINYDFNTYYQKENYFKLDERMRKGKYQRFDVNSDRIDKGIQLNLSNYFTKNHILSFGGEMKWSSVAGGDYYVTSTDSVVNEGKMQDIAFYLQDEISFFNKKLCLQLGIRYDRVKFYDGSYTSTDGAWAPYLPPLKEHKWNSFSPKITISYAPNKSIKVYTSIAKGFRASILDDLCRSGWMWVGPKIANPELGHETIYNYEIGATLKVNQKFSISPTFFYAKGKDFLYYVQTGNLLWGKRPIYQRQNITSVNIYGIEIDVNYDFSKQLTLVANYTYNNSKIGSFIKDSKLENKFLKFTPKHQLKAGFFWNNKIINTNISAIYKGEQFSDDENKKLLEDYITFDLQLSKTIKNHYEISLSIHDLFNNQHMESDLYLSPGRIINLKIAARF
jgi:iron complex outermembrane receptor protein